MALKGPLKGPMGRSHFFYFFFILKKLLNIAADIFDCKNKSKMLLFSYVTLQIKSTYRFLRVVAPLHLFHLLLPP